MKRSFIREILEHTNNETISFAGGLPDAKLFPNMQLSKSAVNVLNDNHSLQYGRSTGYEPLKEKIAQTYSDDGFKTTKDNILITSGSQQALDIICRYYKNRKITIEQPSYLGAMNLFDLNNLEQESIELQKDGIDITSFEKSFSNTKLAYLIPDFQNPTGYTYSCEKREHIAKIIQKENGILIEDSPYSLLGYEKQYKSISSQFPAQSYHLGSFSKTLAPGLRVGWIRADKELLHPLIALKEAMDLHTNGLAQYILDDFLDDGTSYIKHLNRLKKTYSKKLQIFCSYLDELLPQFEYTKPKGGMFIYGKLPNISTSSLVKKCLENGVVFVPGTEFYKNSQNDDEIRFNFTNSSSKNIQKGLGIMSDVIKEI